MTVALDGNAIGGLLRDVFGAELTNQRGVCDHCADEAAVAECTVYLGGPGAVVRCRSCGGLLMVLVEIRGVVCVDLDGLRSLTS